MKRLTTIITLVFASYIANASIAADKPQFAFPVDCELGKTCWTVNYVDMDAKEKSATDFTCGPRSYDKHKGTDFAIRSRAEMNKGVNVLAALGGTVLRTRDGETDTTKPRADLDKIAQGQKECGNGVLIDHAKAGFPGLSTIYCHLKKGSITVKPGQPIKQGDKIASVGHSGFAEFPHLHFGITWEGGVMDPYTGLTATDKCGTFKQSLWKDEALKYTPVSIYDGGFAGQAPDFEAIKNGAPTPKILSGSGEAFVFWSAFFGVQEGDQITLEIKDKQGRLFSRRKIDQPKTRARQFYYTGRKLTHGPLPPGTYTGHVQLKREGIAPVKKEFKIRVE